MSRLQCGANNFLVTGVQAPAQDRASASGKGFLSVWVLSQTVPIMRVEGPRLLPPARMKTGTFRQLPNARCACGSLPPSRCVARARGCRPQSGDRGNPAGGQVILLYAVGHHSGCGSVPFDPSIDLSHGSTLQGHPRFPWTAPDRADRCLSSAPTPCGATARIPANHHPCAPEDAHSRGCVPSAPNYTDKHYATLQTLHTGQEAYIHTSR